VRQEVADFIKARDGHAADPNVRKLAGSWCSCVLCGRRTGAAGALARGTAGMGPQWGRWLVPGWGISLGCWNVVHVSMCSTMLASTCTICKAAAAGVCAADGSGCALAAAPLRTRVDCCVARSSWKRSTGTCAKACSSSTTLKLIPMPNPVACKTHAHAHGRKSALS
jgi:hypothetical protein